MSAEAGGSPGAYPGNPSLPKEVREKILSTFRHTLNLFGEGKLDDCLIGCDFILKMDPRFSPARKLQQKAKNPAADVDMDELESVVAGTPTRQERTQAVDTERLLVRAVESFNARDFDAAVAAAEQVLALLPGNRHAQEIAEKARGKKAAQPQFDASRQRAIAALEANRADEARRELETMRDLDPEHPAVALLERRIASAPAPAAQEAGADSSALERQFSMPASEPQIALDDTAPVGRRAPRLEPLSPPAAPGGGGSSLEGLSLDSLPLDLPRPVAPVVPPPRDPHSPAAGPLVSQTPMPPPGSPGDLWTEAAPKEEPELLELEPSVASSEPLIPEPAPAIRPLEPEPPSADQEVEQLLAQGDEAAKRGDRQQAIEIWSRIFLIDINNSDAVTRIEQVRQEMAEGIRRIADGLKVGREAFEAGDLASARETFLKVLAADENDPTARFYLERIEEDVTRSGSPSDPVPASSDVLSAELAVPAASAVAAPAPKAARRASPRLAVNGKVAAIAGSLLLLTGAGFWVMRSRGSEATTQVAGAPTLEEAMVLFREGRVPETVAVLRRIPSGHPDYARAHKLLSSLTGAHSAPADPARAAENEPGETRPAPAAENEPARLRAAAEKALQEKRYIEALKNFNLAAASFPGDPAFAQARARAIEKVTELTPAVKLYNEAEYETAIPIFWRIHSEDRDNQDAREYLERAYFNQGITQLQNGLYDKASEAFAEVITLDPQDQEAARHYQFAKRYDKRDLDLMGRIYVRHVQPRS